MVTEKEIFDKVVGPWEREVFFKSMEAPKRRKEMTSRLKTSFFVQGLMNQFPEIRKIRIETKDTAYEVNRR